eukprot:NODE_4453_length_805_cov_31.654762_g4119_i0.p1 GENE.NODE_4453_length_805_cov_31.654762_g4119_i0~~NODE_4453_length_805_cov_31.654762_g4119_i0.p1  ORF type:complete len:187 (-),score=42.86 NODE_4453_length_805_cov_31.654762_g4119_i0:109-669(-)
MPTVETAVKWLQLMGSGDAEAARSLYLFCLMHGEREKLLSAAQETALPHLVGYMGHASVVIATLATRILHLFAQDGGAILDMLFQLDVCHHARELLTLSKDALLVVKTALLIYFLAQSQRCQLELVHFQVDQLLQELLVSATDDLERRAFYAALHALQPDFVSREAIVNKAPAIGYRSRNRSLMLP